MPGFSDNFPVGTLGLPFKQIASTNLL